MKIAILGATSQIAQDLLRTWSVQGRNFELFLYARNLKKLSKFLTDIDKSLYVADIGKFPEAFKYDVIINFVGVGDPSKALEMSSTIQDVTSTFDNLAINYLIHNKTCKYIFLSSGAAYGSDFSEPASASKKASFNLNSIAESEKYGLAKFLTEVKHRNLAELNIIDLRVFNYFSRFQDMSARYFITDLIRSILDDKECSVSNELMVRDYLHPEDFSQIIDCIVFGPPINCGFDCYSKTPIEKIELLKVLSNEFNLKWKFDDSILINATGNKKNYFSINYKLNSLGYNPQYSSRVAILKESMHLIRDYKY